MFGIWFLFDKSDQEYLSQKIEELSNQYNCPIFIPHITAHGLINENIEEIDKKISNSIKDIKPFFIEKNKLSYSDDFWKTLFIDISPNKNMTKINKNRNIFSIATMCRSRVANYCHTEIFTHAKNFYTF